ncbi:D-aminopeptidase [Natronospira proteinivora]|uniref:D-aminopeptidase n=1 Tax=Natronospira proteinivora TaxID=1807133 RepID=A0ABT1GBI2_9GAMM|nr:P1 family peptidase [Natronospira proteinivora]MCP1727713.1 D-aminopeptidase [Natronospira proteinivora]
MRLCRSIIPLGLVLGLLAQPLVGEERPRARDLGIAPGVLPAGELNAITDVEDVRVGHVSLVSGDDIRTGVTAVLPHGGNLFQDKVPGAVYTANGFGKAAGFEQVRELGVLESPILLTNTLNVGTTLEAGVAWMLEQDGNEDVHSVNVVVGETNDGFLNDIRSQSVRPQHVFSAIESAEGGTVAEGNVGAGTGTRAFGWKAGIGTASRALPDPLGGYTVGVLVQSNFGGVLTMDGARVGEALGSYTFREEVETELELELNNVVDEQGSIMVVIATDAPVSERNLERMAKRASLGIGRSGGFMSNGSGDFMVAFSTSDTVSHQSPSEGRSRNVLADRDMDPLFMATVEATEEAIYNSLLQAESMTGRQGNHMEALPIERLEEILDDR